MKRSYIGRFHHLSVFWVLGPSVLALATWACFQLDLSLETVSCVYLVIIVLLSLMDSLVSSVAFSVIAVACLDYFFIGPLFTLEVGRGQDLATLSAFLISSLIVTSLVRRLRHLGQSQHERARLLDLTRDAVLVRSLENVITYWNRGAEELYGWKRQEAVGRISHEFLRTTFPAPYDQITEILFSSGYWEGELQHTRRDGTQVTVASRWSLQRDDDGKPTGTLESNTDITERKRAEDALRRIQETYLAEAQQLSHTGSFGWNVSSGAIFLSEEGLGIFGFDSMTSLAVDLVLARTHPDDRANVTRLIGNAATDRQDFDFECRLLMLDGNVKHIHVVARTMNHEDSNVEFVGAVMDVTAIRLAQLELQNTRAELEQVMRVASLGELTASIAHEVNQPLGAIVANAEACLSWLDRKFPDLNEARAATEAIIRDGLRSSEVIRRIHALIKKTDTEMVPLDVNQVVSESVNLVRHELVNRQVPLRTEISADLPLILGDRIQLRQVLLNLITNSVEAMQPITDRPRELLIQSEQDETQQVRVTVTDHGIGFCTEDAQKMFDALVTTKSDGMGMGLSICRSIIRAHGGRIWASKNEPHGASVQFTLPVHRPE